MILPSRLNPETIKIKEALKVGHKHRQTENLDDLVGVSSLELLTFRQLLI
jgi:hypothetical protein